MTAAWWSQIRQITGAYLYPCDSPLAMRTFIVALHGGRLPLYLEH